jgi:succinate dehydrogenase / fumarate reductase cytochrome b subunit
VPEATVDNPTSSRSYFYLARLHSLLGLVPVGAFLCLHLTINATMLAGPDKYQTAVETIHYLARLGLLIPLELLFIFLPLLFHGLFGLIILFRGSVNLGRYPYRGNIRYLLQRATGLLVFAFLFYHLWQMHWLGKPFGGALFVGSDPNTPLVAASSAADAIRSSALSIAVYLLGLVSAVFHLANGLWTALITWGITIGPRSQKRSGYCCAAFGLLLGLLSLLSLYAFTTYRASPERLHTDRAARLAQLSREVAP